MDQEYKTTGPIRDSSLYISGTIRKALAWVKDGETADELAEKIITKWLQENHPTVLFHIENQRAEDKVFRSTLKPKPF
jgi:hypothetical protein